MLSTAQHKHPHSCRSEVIGGDNMSSNDHAEQMLAQQFRPDMDALKKQLFHEYDAPSGMKVVLRRLSMNYFEQITEFYQNYGEAAKIEALKLKEKQEKQGEPDDPEEKEPKVLEAEAEFFNKQLEDIDIEDIDDEILSPEMAELMTGIVNLVLPACMVSPEIGTHISMKDISIQDGTSIFWIAMQFSNMEPEQFAQARKSGEEQDRVGPSQDS